MSRISLWDRSKNDDYRFIDETIREMFDVGGVEVLVHKYLGVVDQGDTGDATQPSASKSKKKGVMQIQDLLFLENRDRQYDPNLYEIKAIYNMQDTEFDIRQFGLFLEADTLYLEFHLNECLEKIGRKLMSGDVLEFPHLRDDALLDEDAPAVNKFYKIEDVNRAAGGWSPIWRPHILRVKIKPLTDSQEFSQILDREVEDSGLSLRDILSDFRDEIGISESIVEQAEADVPFRNFETAHFYVVPGDEMGKQYPWIFAGDGQPPNGAVLAGSGTSFPENPREGDWFLNTSTEPHVLYQRIGSVWQRREVDYRKKWCAAHRILQTFINNNNVSNIQGEKIPEKTALSKAIKPRADF